MGDLQWRRLYTFVPGEETYFVNMGWPFFFGFLSMPSPNPRWRTLPFPCGKYHNFFEHFWSPYRQHFFLTYSLDFLSYELTLIIYTRPFIGFLKMSVQIQDDGHCHFFMINPTDFFKNFSSATANTLKISILCFFWRKNRNSMSRHINSLRFPFVNQLIIDQLIVF
jgi:hypothetical protein